MNDTLKKHMRRLPLYVFVLGILILFFYVGSVWDVQSPGRSLAVFLMIPFYFGCVALLSFIVWVIVKMLK